MTAPRKQPGSILVVGGGGHAKAVVGAAKVSGYDVRAVYDDDADKWGRGILGVPIFGPINRILDAPRMPVIVAIADAATRRAFVERLRLEWATLIHRTAIIDPTVVIAPGTVVFAGVVVQADAPDRPTCDCQRQCHGIAAIALSRTTFISRRVLTWPAAST